MGERQGVDPASTGFFTNVRGLSKQELEELAELVHSLDDRDKQKLRDRMTFILTKTPLELRDILRQNAQIILSSCEETLEAVRKHSEEMGRKLEEHTKIKLGHLEETINAEKKYAASADTLTDEQVLASFVRQVVEHTYYAKDNFRSLPGLEEVEHPAETITAFKRGIRKIIFSFHTPTPGFHGRRDTEIMRRQGVGTKVLDLPRDIHELNDELQKYLLANEGARAVLTAEQEAREARSAEEIVRREKTDLEGRLAEAEKIAKEALSNYEKAARDYSGKQAALQAEVEPLKKAQREAAVAAVQHEAYKRLTEERMAEIKAEKDRVELKNRELNGKLTSALDANITLEEQVTTLQEAGAALETAKAAAEKALADFKKLYDECETQFAALRDQHAALESEHSESTDAFEQSKIQSAKALYDANKSLTKWQLGTLATAVVALGIAVGAAIAVKSKTPLTIERIVEKPVVKYVEKPVEKPAQSSTIYWPVAFGVGYDVDKDAAQLLKETIGRMEAEEGRTYSENEISVALSRIAGNDKVITLSEVERANDQLGYTVLVDGKRFYVGKNEREKLNLVIGRMENEQGRTYNVEEISRIVKATDKNNNRTVTSEEVEILKRLLGY